VLQQLGEARVYLRKRRSVKGSGQFNTPDRDVAVIRIVLAPTVIGKKNAAPTGVVDVRHMR